MIMVRFIITAVSLLSTVMMTGAPSRLESRLKELDSCIEQRERFDRIKQDRIDALHIRLNEAQAREERDRLDYALFEEYKSFKYDSAYFYANRALESALSQGNALEVAQAQCAVTFCYMSSGLFKEAFDMIETVDSKSLDPQAKIKYYDLYNRLYFDLADYGNASSLWDKYLAEGGVYADSLMAVCPEDSYEWRYAKAQLDIKNARFDECLAMYGTLLADYETTDHQKAIINSSIGGAYRSMGQLDSAAWYLAEAAIWDIRSATKETTALYLLAEVLSHGRQAERSYDYIHVALEDADFYNARHRKLSINPILPVIEKARMDSLTRQRNHMIVIVALCALTLLLIIGAVIIFLIQNARLRKKSRQLEEASRIKDEYIGHSFYVNSEFIAETEEIYKTIHQKITARQYDDLKDMSKLSKVNKRRESMYASFDQCFLRLFPTFVKEYAKLFPEGFVDPELTELTPEMRIFALIRMGITDSERISKILNYSVHTIYTYKTRIKNKSIVSNEEFEKRIKAVKMG